MSLWTVFAIQQLLTNHLDNKKQFNILLVSKDSIPKISLKFYKFLSFPSLNTNFNFIKYQKMKLITHPNQKRI